MIRNFICKEPAFRMLLSGKLHINISRGFSTYSQCTCDGKIKPECSPCVLSRDALCLPQPLQLSVSEQWDKDAIADGSRWGKSTLTPMLEIIIFTIECKSQ